MSYRYNSDFLDLTPLGGDILVAMRDDSYISGYGALLSHLHKKNVSTIYRGMTEVHANEAYLYYVYAYPLAVTTFRLKTSGQTVEQLPLSSLPEDSLLRLGDSVIVLDLVIAEVKYSIKLAILLSDIPGREGLTEPQAMFLYEDLIPDEKTLDSFMWHVIGMGYDPVIVSRKLVYDPQYLLYGGKKLED